MSLSLSYPTVNPSLLLDFAASGVLDPRITFSRSTTAVYYDGDTTAKAEENLALQSQTFNVTPWTTGTYFLTVTANSTTAPDGTVTADTITATAGTPVTFGPYIGYSSTVVAIGVVVSASMYVKKNTHDFFQLWLWNQSAGYANFNLATGVIGTAGAGVTNQTITAVGNGWYRCTMTFTTIATNCMVGAGIVASASAARLAVFSPVGTESVYIWGAQLEQRSTVTAYTPTTTATITDYIPQLLTAPAGQARFEHDPITEEALGLLIEEARTNAFTYSADFSNAAWPKTNVIVQNTAGIAPDGSQTLNKIIADTTNGNHFYYRSLGTLANGTYTYSIYAKQGGLTRFLFYLNQAGSNVSTVVTFVGGVAVAGTAAVSGSVYSAASAGSTSVGNGVYRIALSFTVTGSAGDYAAFILYSPDQTTTGFAGNGYDGIYIWGAQFETGAFATSYIATTTTALPRSADVAALTGTNFSSWYNQGTGTIYVEGRFLSEPAYASGSWSQRFFDISDGTVTNGIRCFREETSALDWIRATVVSNTILVVLSNTTNTTNNQDYKICVGYETNNCALSLAGQAVVASVAVALPLSVNRMNIGSTSFVPQGFLNGTVKQLTYYPDRVTNAQLVTLTRG